MSGQWPMLIAGLLTLTALAEARAQVCTHGSATSLYVCFPYASPAAPSKAGASKLVAPNNKNQGAAKDPAFMTLKFAPWSTKDTRPATRRTLGDK